MASGDGSVTSLRADLEAGARNAFQAKGCFAHENGKQALDARGSVNRRERLTSRQRSDWRAAPPSAFVAALVGGSRRLGLWRWLVERFAAGCGSAGLAAAAACLAAVSAWRPCIGSASCMRAAAAWVRRLGPCRCPCPAILGSASDSGSWLRFPQASICRPRLLSAMPAPASRCRRPRRQSTRRRFWSGRYRPDRLRRRGRPRQQFRRFRHRRLQPGGEKRHAGSPCPSCRRRRRPSPRPHRSTGACACRRTSRRAGSAARRRSAPDFDRAERGPQP